MVKYETLVRRKARKRFIMIRNIKDGVRVYLPDGITKITFQNWFEVDEFLISIVIEAGRVNLPHFLQNKANRQYHIGNTHIRW